MQKAAEQRRDDHDARRERHRHRRARRPGAGPGRDRPEVPRLTRPSELEGEATNRAIVLAERGRNVPALHRAHVGAARRSRRWPRRRDEGRNVFGETCPQYLYLSLEDHARRSPGFEGAKWVCSHAAAHRGTTHHQDDLWKGLRMNDLAVVSHRPLPVLLQGAEGARARRLLEDPERHRRRRAPHGPASTRVSSTASISLERWVETCCTTPARMFGLYPPQGRHRPGRRRRHRGLRPERRTPTIGVDKTHHMNMDHSAWEGFVIDGKVDTVLSPRHGGRSRTTSYVGRQGPRPVPQARACRST